jgi:hypothetical protein
LPVPLCGIGRQTIALAVEQQERVVAGGLELAVVSALLLLSIHRDLGGIQVEDRPVAIAFTPAQILMPATIRRFRNRVQIGNVGYDKRLRPWVLMSFGEVDFSCGPILYSGIWKLPASEASHKLAFRS